MLANKTTCLTCKLPSSSSSNKYMPKGDYNHLHCRLRLLHRAEDPELVLMSLSPAGRSKIRIFTTSLPLWEMKRELRYMNSRPLVHKARVASPLLRLLSCKSSTMMQNTNIDKMQKRASGLAGFTGWVLPRSSASLLSRQLWLMPRSCRGWV